MRNRFEPPMPNTEAELRSPAFLRLLTQAGTADAYDREADARDVAYWVDKEGQGLIDRGIEISHKFPGPLGGLWYFWDRRIGWQAGGADVALYGPFANNGEGRTPNTGPAAGWRTPFYDVDQAQQPPAAPPTPPGVLERIDLALGELRLNDALLRSALAELIALQLAGTSGSLLGYTLNMASRTDRRAELEHLVATLRGDV